RSARDRQAGHRLSRLQPGARWHARPGQSEIKRWRGVGGAGKMTFEELFERSTTVKAAKPVKDIELALREVCDHYAPHLPKQKILDALDVVTEEVSDESWPEKKSGAAGDDDIQTSEEGTD